VPPVEAIGVGPNHTIKSLYDLQSKQQEGKTYLLDPIEFTFTDAEGIELRAKGVTLLGQPGTIIRYAGNFSSTEFPACIEVMGVDQTIKGIEFRGASKTRGFEIKSGSANTFITECTATVDENGKARLGQFVQIERGIDVTITKNTCTRLRRYGVFADHVDGLLIEGNFIGPSDGGTLNGRSFDGEHNIRLYDFSNVVIRDNKLQEKEKSSLNIRQGDGILIEGNEGNGFTFGPLMDGAGDATNPDMRVRNLTCRGNTIRGQVVLEMGLTLEMYDNDLYPPGSRAINVRYQSKYASRGCAKGVVKGNRIHSSSATIIAAESGGTLSGLQITDNVRL
jgi:hypothetical protein